jgi:hypothetical protein
MCLEELPRGYRGIGEPGASSNSICVPYGDFSKVICECEYRVAIRVGGEEQNGVRSGDDEGRGDEGDGESRSSSSVSNNDGTLMDADELFLRSLAGRFGGGETECAYEELMAVNGQEDMSHVETRSYIVNAFFCGGASKRHGTGLHKRREWNWHIDVDRV